MVLALVFGWRFVKVTFHYSMRKPDEKSLEVLSYNAHAFKPRYTHWGFSGPMIDWVVQDTAAIKCIQEFDTNERKPDQAVIKKMINAGYYAYTTGWPKRHQGNRSNLAIFSKYPIVNQGIFPVNESTGNHAIFADIIWQKDTIRIYTVRLFSMGIPLQEYRDVDKYESKMKQLIHKLKDGSVNRSIEINHLIEQVEKCPYPYLICGDFNGIPYGYNYRKLKEHFGNAFDQAGHGFGFTFNSESVFFLRIDHQFFSSQLVPDRLVVDRSMPISDHFPVRGNYHLKK